MISLLKEKGVEIITALLFAVALVFLYLNINPPRIQAQDACYPHDYVKSETIYSEINCADCNCVEAGRKLFTFQGTEANCEDAETEAERASCYYLQSFGVYECAEIKDQVKYELCMQKYRGELFKYNTGRAGTLITRSGVFTNGTRTYLNGFDNQGKHIIKTGFTDFFSDAITLRQGTGDVEIGGDFSTSGKELSNLYLLSPNSGIYLSGDVEYEPDSEGDMVRVNERMSTGIESRKHSYSDLYFMANGNSLLKFYDAASSEYFTMQSIFSVNDPLTSFFVLFEKSIQIGDPMNKTEMLVRDKRNPSYIEALNDWGDLYVSDRLFFRNGALGWTKRPLDESGVNIEDDQYGNRLKPDFILFFQTNNEF